MYTKRAKFKYFFGIVPVSWAVLAFLPAGRNLALPMDSPVEKDVEHWSRIVVEKAFISRDTYLDYRDAHSAPEFGWHLRQGSDFLAGGALYTTLFVPLDSKTKLRMALVERDVFADDLVAAFDLKSGRHRYDITSAGDFAVVERTSFLPDRRSGGDSRPPGRRLQAGKDFADSVSFLEGDFTDYYRIENGSSRSPVHIFYAGRCRLDFPGSEAKFFPARDVTGSVYLIDAGAAERLRVRAAVGGKRCKYVLRLFQGSGVRAGVRKRYLRQLDPSRNFTDFSRFVKTMNAYDPQGTRKFCLSSRSLETERIACAFFLYKHGSARDRERLDRVYDSRSERYRQLLRRYHRGTK